MLIQRMLREDVVTLLLRRLQTIIYLLLCDVAKFLSRLIYTENKNNKKMPKSQSKIPANRHNSCHLLCPVVNDSFSRDWSHFSSDNCRTFGVRTSLHSGKKHPKGRQCRLRTFRKLIKACTKNLS